MTNWHGSDVGSELASEITAEIASTTNAMTADVYTVSAKNNNSKQLSQVTGTSSKEPPFQTKASNNRSQSCLCHMF